MHNNTTRAGKKRPVKFACVEGCSDCCIYREYYPSTDFGKIGVLLMPEEKSKMEKLAKEKGVEVRILPRLAVGRAGPEKIIAYQMMGRQKDGDLCPFLDLEKRSPHGGFSCGIYKQRPLACSAYPVVDADSRVATLDSHCQFCKHHDDSTKAGLEGLENELESLSKIKSAVKAENGERVWRYATATGELATLGEGWVLES